MVTAHTDQARQNVAWVTTPFLTRLTVRPDRSGNVTVRGCRRSAADAGTVVEGGHGGLHDRERALVAVGERLAAADDQGAARPHHLAGHREPLPGGGTLNAANPHAVSMTEATAPACRNPCCWVNRSSCRSDISTLPGSTEVTSTPSVLIMAWRSKLARTRASISSVVSVTRRLCH